MQVVELKLTVVGKFGFLSLMVMIMTPIYYSFAFTFTGIDAKMNNHTN
jgi:hypothetical protein